MGLAYGKGKFVCVGGRRLVEGYAGGAHPGFDRWEGLGREA